MALARWLLPRSMMGRDDDGVPRLTTWEATSLRDLRAGRPQQLKRTPIARRSFGGYVNRRAPRISVKAYLDAFRESDKKKGSLLNSDAGDLRRDETVSNSVVTTCFFNPQGIPEFVLHNYKGDLTDNADGVKDDEDNDEFEDDLDVLRGYSLVSVTAKRDVCEMHTLVQFCTRVWLSIAGSYEAAENLGEKAVKMRKRVLGEEHPLTLTSMANLASTYMNQGRWKEAEEL
ncbi:hypothetical protein EDB81DRAFT_759388 [Dactylonectria macrodidyma]|uniref:Kinesin light chain n=1 Tax=Dactylonectria macrodidyma TaxID=307937 RepID=A0A9P9EVL3_9HYPO|nr:hypothetical protein EDB81DRAFT_759388 [Dactylonectria macrodidyma]